MPSKVAKIQPYNDTDYNYVPLVDFVRRYIPVLQPSTALDIPVEQSNYAANDADYSKHESGWQYGDKAGIKVSQHEELEPRADGVAVSGVIVETFGLEGENSIRIQCERYWYDPRYIELQVSGTESAIDEVVSAFQTEFGQSALLTDDQIFQHLLDAKAAIMAGAWNSAAIGASAVLAQQPENGEANFYMGVALAATGKYDEASPLLQKATAADPQNYDAWYNLANVSLEQGKYDQAVEDFRRALELSPDNHPVYYRLAVALEKAGKTAEAIAAYRDAVRTAPNPDQAWGYSGMDFESQAKEALQRLEPQTPQS